MRLSWKDGAATAVGALVVAMVLAVTRGWGWPLLGSERIGVLLLATVGLVMCALGGLSETGTPPTFAGRPVSGLLHVAVGVLLVVGLAAPSRWTVFAMGGVILGQWLVSSIAHATRGRASRLASPPAVPIVGG
jgi:hypothetical protein